MVDAPQRLQWPGSACWQRHSSECSRRCWGRWPLHCWPCHLCCCQQLTCSLGGTACYCCCLCRAALLPSPAAFLRPRSGALCAAGAGPPLPRPCTGPQSAPGQHPPASEATGDLPRPLSHHLRHPALSWHSVAGPWWGPGGRGTTGPQGPRLHLLARQWMRWQRGLLPLGLMQQRSLVGLVLLVLPVLLAPAAGEWLWCWCWLWRWQHAAQQRCCSAALWRVP